MHQRCTASDLGEVPALLECASKTCQTHIVGGLAYLKAPQCSPGCWVAVDSKQALISNGSATCFPRSDRPSFDQRRSCTQTLDGVRGCSAINARHYEACRNTAFPALVKCHRCHNLEVPSLSVFSLSCFVDTGGGSFQPS